MNKFLKTTAGVIKILLLFFSINSCNEDYLIEETTTINKPYIVVNGSYKEKIEDTKIAQHIQSNLPIIQAIFQKLPTKSMRKMEQKGEKISINDIKINTELFLLVEGKNHYKSTYTFDIDFPISSDDEIINLVTYYDENNQIQSYLIKYDLTDEELKMIHKNRNYNGFEDRVSYIDLEEIKNQPYNKLNKSSTCSCSVTYVDWTSYNIGHSILSTGSGGGGVGPSNATLIAMGYGYLIPGYYTLFKNPCATKGPPSAECLAYQASSQQSIPITTPIKIYNITDLYIPNGLSSADGISTFNSYYSYYFPTLKDQIRSYYRWNYNPSINAFGNYDNITFNQHIKKQSFVDSFFYWLYKLNIENPTLFNQLKNNTDSLNQLFNYFAEFSHKNSEYLLVGPNPFAQYSSEEDVRYIDWLGTYLLNNNFDITQTDWLEKLKKKQIAFKINEKAKTNPKFLIDIPCWLFNEWKDVAKFDFPQEFKNKLSNLNMTDTDAVMTTNAYWQPLGINDAFGPSVNLDMFSVEFSEMPKNPATNQQFTPKEFYHYIRTHFNDFFQGSNTQFTNYTTYQGVPLSTNWYDNNNYLGTIMRFDILVQSLPIVPDLTQAGSVICTYVEETPTLYRWRFSTIRSPRDYDHPVSGVREFGLYKSPQNGKWVFYNRAADRITEATDYFFGGYGKATFEGADKTWKKVFDNLKNFVNSNSSNPTNATELKEQKIRPNFNLIEDIMNGVKPLNELPDFENCP